ncbi:hypothetical protein SAMN00017405_2102 [Desulfonispora thiosulfatigenes DSM 11270]|uniref:Uncharacterized protein n=1 Tax=Desulfonispora thiosulfatigenes DSM 11270 TaxID=656914 RepID=A0A1W1VHP7_DESTI|nr:hypothetical protein SAMN00017405_2102 [Desulfonispora thiosulfatigenes DSM 11270]
MVTNFKTIRGTPFLSLIIFKANRVQFMNLIHLIIILA